MRFVMFVGWAKFKGFCAFCEKIISVKEISEIITNYSSTEVLNSEVVK